MPPNVLFIMTDQQRKDSLGCYGNAVCRTPNLDQLAKQAVRFERSYVANPICMPSRMSMFTGRTPRSHGLWTNGLLIDEQPTVAGHFARHGYMTGSIGKIHYSPTGTDGHMESGSLWADGQGPLDWNGPYWGFEHVQLTIGHTAPVAHYGQWFREHGGTPQMRPRREVTGAPASGVRDIPAELHDSIFVADRTSAFIKQCAREHKPFFLVASFPDPHAPFDPPAEVAQQYPHDAVTMPVGGPLDLATRPSHYQQHYQGAWHRGGQKKPKHPQGLSQAHTRERIAHTYAMVDLIDRAVGRILQTLQEQGLDQETIVVFTSDHGELLGDHGLWLKGPFFYESLINVPLIIRAPDVAPGVSDTMFSHLDLAPTLCEMTGLPAMPFVDGISQAAHLLDPQKQVRDRCLVEYRSGYGDADVSSKVLVTHDLKYVRYQTGEEELTDLQADPKELRNVAADPTYRQERERLRMMLLDEVLKTERKGPEQLSHG